ncbi:SpoIIE family protein phosphatase [Streptomyces sp. L7]
MGGDWFDVIPLSGARVALVVGDVVGHGLHAAAAMGRLRTAVRTLADVDLAPDELLTQLDDLVIGLAEEADAENASAHVLSDIGATCLYAVYDPVSGTCTAARAGHPAPALVQPDGEVRFLDLPTGPPLGVGGLPFETSETALPPGSVLALFTDGLIESRETDLDVRLEQLRLSLSAPAPSLEALCDHVVETLLPEYHSDDAALLMVRAHGLDEGQVASWRVPAEPEAVGKVRRDVARRLADWDLEELGFTTELAVSELVTNAIRYGATPSG